MATNLEKMQKIARAEKKSGEPKKRSSSSNQTVKDFNFNVYVYKVLKQVHPDTGISGDAKACMVNLVKINVAKIMNAANQLVLRSGVRTISSRDIQSAVRIVLPGELAKHAVSEGTKAVTKYNASKGDSKKGDGKPIQKSVRAGLTFNVTRIEKLMMLESTTARKSAGAAVYLTAVAECLAAEVLELSGNSARDNKRIRITARNIKLAILNDEELNRLYFDTVIAGGVVPRIESALLLHAKEDKPKRPKKTTSAITEVKDVKPKKTASKTSPKKAAPTSKKAVSKASPKNPSPAKKVATKPKKVAILKTAKK